MYLLPVHLVQKQDLVLPGTTAYLELQISDIPKFKPQARTTADGERQQIVIVTSEADLDKCWPPTPETMNEFFAGIAPLGVLCNVNSREESDICELVTLESLERVHVYSPVVENKVVLFQISPVDEVFNDIEELLVDEIFTLVQSIIHKGDSFPAALVKELTSFKLGDKCAWDVLGILGRHLMIKPQEKLQWLQSTDNMSRWENLMDRVRFLTAEPAKKPRPPAAKKKSVSSLAERVKELPITPGYEDKITKELTKLQNLPASSTEYSHVVDYLEELISIPWGTAVHHPIDLKNFCSVLDKTHYGLPDVKQHILEHMCIESIAGQSTGTVLCFLGPPGTGKTSIASQIAAAGNRVLNRIALGGLSDEAEIRGHRRTYISSKPGRFITGVQHAKSLSPVFLLDEVDKITSGRGDPTSALLEVLDPEQNNQFIDRYIEIPVDLSKAMFICTANYEEQIPEALRDRMEFIHFREYTFDERKVITQSYMLPRLLAQYKIQAFDIKLEEQVLDRLCSISQVRQIEKTLAKLLRASVVNIHIHEHPCQVIDLDFYNKVTLAKTITRKKIGFN